MNLERFGWPLYSGPFFNFCKGFVTSLKMYSLVMPFFYQLIFMLKETKYKKSKHRSLVLH